VGRRDFASSKKKSAYLGMAKAIAKSDNAFFGQLKKADRMGRGFVDDKKEESRLSAPGSTTGGSDFNDLLDSIVFKDELRDYVSSIINNAEPNEYVYDDVIISASAARPSAGGGPDWGTLQGKTGSWLFDKNQDERLEFVYELPHSYMEGTDVEVHVHWCPVDTDTGDVSWRFGYSWANINGTLPVPGAELIGTAADPADGTAFKHQYHDLGEMDGTGKTISSVITAYLYRDVSEDDYDADAAMLSIDFHIKKDARGSKEEHTK